MRERCYDSEKEDATRRMQNYALLKVIKFNNNESEDEEVSDWLDVKEYEVQFHRKKKGPSANLDHYLKICLNTNLSINTLHNQTLSW